LEVTALIDSGRSRADETLAANRAGFVTACTTEGIDCHVLERRALER